VRYCAAEPGWHFSRGQIARAQAEAIERGWLEPLPARPPSFLRATLAGCRAVDAGQGGDAGFADVTKPHPPSPEHWPMPPRVSS